MPGSKLPGREREQAIQLTIKENILRVGLPSKYAEHHHKCFLKRHTVSNYETTIITIWIFLCWIYRQKKTGVITSYSIHYTKLYEIDARDAGKGGRC